MPPTALEAKLARTGPRRLLALDGGGIRGLVTIEVMARIEELLRAELRKPDLVLADWFDAVGGTSTGAILAACVSLGMRVSEIRAFYEQNGEAMFDRASIRKRFSANKYEDAKLATKLKETFSQDGKGFAPLEFGSDRLRTILLLVMHNVTTDSPWPLSNNPAARYNARDRKDCNLRLPLWQLVRASTAAPVFFPPEQVTIGPKEFVFVDGGLTPFNDPAFQIFLQCTLPAYQLRWPPGEKEMLVVSIGTGLCPKLQAKEERGWFRGAMGRVFGLGEKDMVLHENLDVTVGSLMNSAIFQQDLLCRTVGRCRHGAEIDRELGTLVGAAGTYPSERAFTYVRYNGVLSREGLDALGLQRVKPEDVQSLDSIAHMPELQDVGRAVAKQVAKEHFAGFLGA